MAAWRQKNRSPAGALLRARLRDKRVAIRPAVFVDIEATGMDPAEGDRMVEIAVVDDSGHVLLDSLVDPGRGMPDRAVNIHGISRAMLRDAPTLDELWPEIYRLTVERQVVFFDADADTRFFPGELAWARRVDCAMLGFARSQRVWDAHHGNWRRQGLDFAARHIGYRWRGPHHRALPDALACRAVWRWLQRQPTTAVHASPTVISART
ncbi:MAG: 3'-5' exonuclease [bacterium]